MNLEDDVLKNELYRKILATTSTMQVAAMHLNASETIEKEVHDKSTQFIVIVSGTASVEVDGKPTVLDSGMALTIPPGAEHEVTARTRVELYTIYAPPVHEVR